MKRLIKNVHNNLDQDNIEAPQFLLVYLKYEIKKPHTSHIPMTYKYIRVKYGWHTSTNEYIPMTYEYIRVTYGRHTIKCEWHSEYIWVYTSGIQMACEWKKNGIRNFKPYKGSGAFRT